MKILALLLLISLSYFLFSYFYSDSPPARESIQQEAFVEKERVLAPRASKPTTEGAQSQKNTPAIRVRETTRLSQPDKSSEEETLEPPTVEQIAEWERLARMDRVGEEELLKLAEHYLSKEKFNPEKAENFLKAAIHKNPENQFSVNELMALYTTQNDEAQADQLIHELLVTHPNSVVVNDAIGNWKSYLKNFGAAAEHFERALAIKGYNESLTRKAAVAYLKSHQPGKAAQAFRRILNRLNEGKEADPVAKKYTQLELANALIQNGNCPEASRLLELSNDPNLKQSHEKITRRYRNQCL